MYIRKDIEIGMIPLLFVVKVFTSSNPRLIHNLYAPDRHVRISEIRAHLPTLHEERHIATYPKVECVFEDNCKTELNPNTGEFETQFGDIHEERHPGLISPEDVEVEKFYDSDTGTNKIVVTMPGKLKDVAPHHEVVHAIERPSIIRETVHYPLEDRIPLGHEILPPSSEFLSKSYRALKSAHEISHRHRS